MSRIQGEFDEKAKKREEMSAFKENVSQPTAGTYMQQQQAQQQGGGPPPAGVPMGGAPMGGTPGAGDNSNKSLAELSEQASDMAQQLVTLPDYDRKKQLKMLREGNKELHSLVMADLSKLRQEASSQGQQMVLGQSQPQGQACKPFTET